MYVCKEYLCNYIDIVNMSSILAEMFVDLNEHRNLKLRMLRIYSSAVASMDYPGPTQQPHPDTICQEWARPYALHYLMKRSEYEHRMRQKSAELGRRNATANGKLCNDYRSELCEAETTFLTNNLFDIVFCTCSEASGERIKRHKYLTPRQCIIDDCGMVSEPETIVLVSLCEHVVLIGDHNQLQPVVEYQPAKDHGLSTSLFERYVEHYEGYKYLLKIQYTMVRFFV